MSERRMRARELAAEALRSGEPTAWFERLYAEAGGDASVVPWADLQVNPNLAEWLTARDLRGDGRRALTVGCGLGDDAEELARRGFAVVAFDISPTAVAWCRARFPGSPVEYRTADLFAAPADWNAAFDFVLESYTLQVLPPNLRGAAADRTAGFLRPGGTLLVIARGQTSDMARGPMPCPVTHGELARFRDAGLREVAFEEYLDEETPPVRRFRAEYRR